MTKNKKKRNILTATLAVAMAAAIGVNWYYGDKIQNENNETQERTNLGDSIYVNANTESTSEISENITTTEVAKSDEYFAKAQLKRTQSHDSSLDEIQKILESKGANKQVEDLLSDYTKTIKLETDIENLITAKINCKCLAIINDDNAEIVVESDAIDELYMLQITEIVSTQSGIPAENIIIIQAK